MAVHYVYKFISIYNQVLYVGETNNINRRVREHLSCNPSRTCFVRSDLKYISRIDYITVKSPSQGKLVEKYYILKYLSPVLKNRSIPRQRVNIKKPPDNWKTYMQINKMRKVGNKCKNKRNALQKIILVNIIFWLFTLYYIFK